MDIMSPEKAWWPPATIKVTNFKCLDETSEPSASDEIFLLVLSVDLTHSISQRMDSLLAQPVVQGMTYRDLLQKAGIDLSAVTEEIPTIPQLDVRLYGPYEDVDEDDTIWIREKPFWYFDGQPRKLNSPDDVIFVIALAELDTGDDQEIARAMMKGTAMVSLASSLNLDRATRADILVRDFCTMNSV